MDIDRILRRLNPLIAAVLRSPLHFLLSGGVMLITVTGRRTGRRYAIPVGYQRVDERIDVLVSKAPRKSWWRNYESPAPVEMRVRGRRLRGMARLVPPSDAEFRDAIEQTLERMPWLGRQFGIDYDRAAGIDADQWAVLAESNALVSIALDRGA